MTVEEALADSAAKIRPLPSLTRNKQLHVECCVLLRGPCLLRKEGKEHIVPEANSGDRKGSFLWSRYMENNRKILNDVQRMSIHNRLGGCHPRLQLWPPAGSGSDRGEANKLPKKEFQIPGTRILESLSPQLHPSCLKYLVGWSPPGTSAFLLQQKLPLTQKQFIELGYCSLSLPPAVRGRAVDSLAVVANKRIDVVGAADAVCYTRVRRQSTSVWGLLSLPAQVASGSPTGLLGLW